MTSRVPSNTDSMTCNALTPTMGEAFLWVRHCPLPLLPSYIPKVLERMSPATPFPYEQQTFGKAKKVAEMEGSGASLPLPVMGVTAAHLCSLTCSPLHAEPQNCHLSHWTLVQCKPFLPLGLSQTLPSGSSFPGMTGNSAEFVWSRGFSPSFQEASNGLAGRPERHSQ